MMFATKGEQTNNPKLMKTLAKKCIKEENIDT